jgi:hypothetical protein
MPTDIEAEHQYTVRPKRPRFLHFSAPRRRCGSSSPLRPAVSPLFPLRGPSVRVQNRRSVDMERTTAAFLPSWCAPTQRKVKIKGN